MDLNILIRTLTAHADRVDFRAGAGIVVDSDAATELAETRAKARGLLNAIASSVLRHDRGATTSNIHVDVEE